MQPCLDITAYHNNLWIITACAITGCISIIICTCIYVWSSLDKIPRYSFSLRNHRKPTPAEIRRISNSMLASCGSVTGISYLCDFPKIAAFFLVLTFGSTFLSNMFAHPDQKAGDENDHN